MTPRDERIEKAAKAAYDGYGSEHWDRWQEWELTSAVERESWRFIAAAVLAAVDPPRAAVLDRGERAALEQLWHDASELAVSSRLELADERARAARLVTALREAADFLELCGSKVPGFDAEKREIGARCRAALAREEATVSSPAHGIGLDGRCEECDGPASPPLEPPAARHTNDCAHIRSWGRVNCDCGFSPPVDTEDAP